MTITRAECDALVEEKITAIAGAYRDGLFNDGSVEEYRRQRALAICRQVCWSAVEQVRAGQIAAISPEAPAPTTTTSHRSIQPPPCEKVRAHRRVSLIVQGKRLFLFLI